MEIIFLGTNFKSIGLIVVCVFVARDYTTGIDGQKLNGSMVQIKAIIVLYDEDKAGKPCTLQLWLCLFPMV